MTDPSLQRLVTIILEDADVRVRREEDRSINAARQVLLDAQDHVRELRRAAKELGRTRGGAAEAALEREADREIQAVYAGAFEALQERTQRRLALTLGDLPKDEPRYASALRTWARAAMPRMDRPCQVLASRGDRLAIYDALLGAGAQDYQVVHDPKVHVGFIVRDLDGRTVFDGTPAGLAASAADEIRAGLQARIEPIVVGEGALGEAPVGEIGSAETEPGAEG